MGGLLKKLVGQRLVAFWPADPRRVHFLHIGKTGGTAIREALRGVHDSGRYALVMHNHHTTLRDIRKGEKVVVFLRDPLSRFVSGFYSRKTKGQPRYQSHWNATEERVFAAFDTPNELALALAYSDSANHQLALEAMARIKHLVGYKKWLVSSRYLSSRRDDLFHIGFQESLDDDFERLRQKLGLPEMVALPTDDVAAYRSQHVGYIELDETAEAALKAWYRTDYELVAVCRQLSASGPG